MRDDWTETTLGENIEIVMGQAPPGKDCNKDGIGVPFVKAGEFTDSYPIVREWTTNPLRFSKSGDTLICVVGATSGKLSKGINCAIGRSVAALRPMKSLDSGFLWNFMAVRIQEMRDGSKGSAQGVITKDDLASLPLNLPSLTEQKRIVDLVSSVDSYIESLQQQVDSARASRNAVLHELLFAGGDDWTETTLGDVADVVMGRQLSPSKRMGTRPRPYLRAANIGNWGISLNDVLEMDFTEDEENHFASKVGDVLLVEGGNEKSVGCPALVSEREQGLCIQNTIIRCRINVVSQVSSEFLYHFLRYSFWAGKFGELCAGTTIMHLGQKRAVVFPLVLPPLDGQKRIVEIVSSMDEVIAVSEQAVADAKNLRSGLLSDLLSGEHEIPKSYDQLMGG